MNYGLKTKIRRRLIYRIDRDAIIMAEVFKKKTKKTPLEVIERSQKRLKAYDDV